ncbi:hypothetical protein IAT38_004244 [Cryptococcus sp. DSM 104549]
MAALPNSPLLPRLQSHPDDSFDAYHDGPMALADISGDSEPGESSEQSVLHREFEPQPRDTRPKSAKPRFSLFARSASERPDELAGEEEADVSQYQEDEGTPRRQVDAPVRRGPSGDGNDRLRESLYELKRINETFDGLLGALEGAKGHNDRLAERVQQTSTLLEEYIAIMGQTEHTKKLAANPEWSGSTNDALPPPPPAVATQQPMVAPVAATIDDDVDESPAKPQRVEKAAAAGRRTMVKPSAGRGTGIPRPSVPAAQAGRGTGRGTWSHVKSSGYGPRS